jgi:hypothetical protein
VLKLAWKFTGRKMKLKTSGNTSGFMVTTIIAGLFLLGGCGGGSPTTTPPPTTLPPTSTTAATLNFASGKYVNNSLYNDQFMLAYTVTNDGVISVGIKAKTLGWLAIAIGSPHGKSDIWIGYVTNGQVTLLDSHDATESGSHPLDVSSGGTNDLTSVTGSESSGITTIEFKRKLDTGDKYDLPLVPGTNVITWAIGPSDDINQEHSVVGLGTFEIPVLPTH